MDRDGKRVAKQKEKILWLYKHGYPITMGEYLTYVLDE